MKKNSSSKIKKKHRLKKQNNILKRVLISIAVVSLIIIFWISFTSDSSPENNFIPPAEIIDSSSVLTEKQKINIKLTKKNMAYRNSWSNYISVGHKGYNYDVLGGIDGLKVYVKNNTEYILNEVIVNVCYVIDNGSCYKNEEVVFYNVPANGFMFLDAPDSNRGTKVVFEIKKVYSDKMNFLYALNYSSGNPSDPNFYKN